VVRAALLLKTLVDERAAFVTSGARDDIPGEASDLIGRAANFRIEADLLRERALATGEPAIREEYLALAGKWSTFAAGLESEVLARLG